MDITGHGQTPITEVNVEEFEFVIAIEKWIRRALVEEHGVSEAKILNVYVNDPFGDDLGAYSKCAKDIAKRLGQLDFAKK